MSQRGKRALAEVTSCGASGGHHAVRATGTQVPEAFTAACASPAAVLCLCLARSWWLYGEERRASLGQEPAAGGTTPTFRLILSDDSPLFCPVLEAQTTASSCMSHSMSTVTLSGRRRD